MMLKCNKGHVWNYTGKKKEGYVNCPKCYLKVNILKNRLMGQMEKDVGGSK